MAAPVDTIGRIVRSLFTVQRIGNTINAEAQVILADLFDQLEADLERIDPTGPSLKKWRDYRTDEFLDRVRERLRVAVPEWEAVVRTGLAVAGRARARDAVQVIVASLGDAGPDAKPTPITQARVRSILNAQPFEGATMSEWAAGMERVTLDRISKQVKIGMTLEESLPDLVKRVRGAQAGYIRQDPHTGQFVAKGTKGAAVRPRFVGGVWQTTTRDAEAVVRSAVSFVDGTSKFETYQANARLIDEYEFVATLDDRTSDICFSLDGRRWKPDEEGIRVPGVNTHFGGCRSELVPHFAYERLGLEPPEEGDRVARDLESLDEGAFDKKVSTRRGQGELGESVRVRGSLRAEQWLRSQSARVQDEILGRGRGRLFRAGKLNLKQLVRDDGTTVPLSELAA